MSVDQAFAAGLQRLRRRYGRVPPAAAVDGLETCLREGLLEVHHD